MTPAIRKILKRLRLGRPVLSPKLTLVHARVMERPVTFCVNMENDPIQRNHRRGTFYELKELKRLIGLFPKGGVFVDIGANVGNHSLFAATFLEPSRVIAFEPNPRAYDLLIENALVNGHGDLFDLSKLGVGLSDKHTGGYAIENRKRNLGGAKMLPGQGDLEVHRADDLLEDVTPAMIKIDVEGMEMAVLAGLSGVFARCKPILLVEVDNENEQAFFDWAKATDYAVVETTQRYRLNKNHLLVDAKAAGKVKTQLKDAQNA